MEVCNYFKLTSPIHHDALFQDAILAAEAGVDGILISNHGGMCFTHRSKSSFLVDESTDAGRQLE